MSEQKMREAFDRLSKQGHMIGWNDFQTGWEAAEQALAAPAGEQVGLTVPEGMSLAPSKMVVTPEALDALMFIAAGSEIDNAQAPLDERWLTAVLFIGEATDDDGNKVHGLHAYSDEYPEEGCTTLVEFPAHEAKRGGAA